MESLGLRLGCAVDMTEQWSPAIFQVNVVVKPGL